MFIGIGLNDYWLVVVGLYGKIGFPPFFIGAFLDRLSIIRTFHLIIKDHRIFTITFYWFRVCECFIWFNRIIYKYKNI